METILNAGLQLFLFVSVVVFVMYILGKLRKIVNFIVSDKKSAAGIVITIIILGVLICLASKYGLTVEGAQINARDSIAVFAAIIGGPIAGIAVGIIGGAYRYMVGGWTALPCSLATLFAGIITALIVYYKKIKPSTLTAKQLWYFVLFVGFWEFIHLDIMVPLLGQKSFSEALTIMNASFLIPMVIFNMVGLATYLLIMRDIAQSQLKIKDLIAKTKELKSLKRK